MSAFESFDNTVKNSLSFLDNEYVSSGLALFLILYAGLAAPKLPESVAKIFDYTLFKILVFFLIVYVAKKSATIAIIAAIGVMVSMMTLNTYKFNKEAMAVVALGDMKKRRFSAGGCECTCGKEKSECDCECNWVNDVRLPKIPNMDNVKAPNDLVPYQDYVAAFPPKDYAAFSAFCDWPEGTAKPHMEEAAKKMEESGVMMEEAKHMKQEETHTAKMEEAKVLRDTKMEMRPNMEMARTIVDESKKHKETFDGFTVDNLELLNCTGRVPGRDERVTPHDPTMMYAQGS